MTKEELEKEAEELIQKFEIANSMNCFMQLTPDRKQIGEMLVMIAEPREKRIAELEKENKKLNRQLSDIVECFQSASSGDDFEMAESAREIMEILDIHCYRHGKVKSKLTEAKGIIKKIEKIFYSGENSVKRLSEISDILTEAETLLSKVEE